MPTKVEIDDDLMTAAQEIAAMRGVGVHVVIEELIRNGLENAAVFPVKDGLPYVPVPDDVPRVTPEQIREAEDET
jgi:hypothetical protein